MTNLDITISLPVFLLAVLGSACIGYFVRNARLRQAAKKIQKLEIELLNNHAEILRMQHELAIRQLPMAPVVPLRDAADEVAAATDNPHPNQGNNRRQAK